MISSNPISAPQLTIGVAIYNDWRAKTSGTLDDFYRFLTDPSPERDEFLEQYKYETALQGRILVKTYRGIWQVAPAFPEAPATPDLPA